MLRHWINIKMCWLCAQILMSRANRDGKIAPRHQGVSWIGFRQHGRNNKDFAGDRVMYECLVLSIDPFFASNEIGFLPLLITQTFPGK